MFYRENGQFKTTYRADQQIFPITQDRIAIALILAVAFLAVPMLAATVHTPVAGLNISVLFKAALPKPPHTSTRPSDKRLAVCAYLAPLSCPVVLQVAVTGSKISTVFKAVLPFFPPTTNTLPSNNAVAVC